MSAWENPPPALGHAATSTSTPDPSFGAPPPDPSFGAPPSENTYGAPAALVPAPSLVAKGRRSRKVAALLALFFGGVGAQRFYLRQHGIGAAIVAMLVLSPVIPPLIGVVLLWALVDTVRYAMMPDADFDAKYNRG